MRILLIDDDSDDRLLFREAFNEISPDAICITEQEGRKALADLRDPRLALPDLIFMDINMPTLTGWQCLEEIKGNERTMGIPVIMFSTSSAERDAERAAQCGAIFLLTKPDDFMELKKILRDILTAYHNKQPLDQSGGFRFQVSGFK